MPTDWILLGGGGFVGAHLADQLTELPGARIVIADIAFASQSLWSPKLRQALASGQASQHQVDVRDPASLALLAGSGAIVVNFAAVHREPGHAPREYFETNVDGARNIVAWAEASGVATLVFTSSIAVYGPQSAAVTEATLPTPDTPYGISKLLAEEILAGWQRAAPGRTLITIRPGVLFGPGEGGNVSRLVRAVSRGYFLYVGNREVKKAGGYVKELCRVIHWLVADTTLKGRASLLNFGLPEVPSLADYVQCIQRVGGQRRWVPSLPFGPMLLASQVISRVAGLFGISTPIHPRRIEKLRISNHIEPRFLVERGYPFAFGLESALADWRLQRPDEWR